MSDNEQDPIEALLRRVVGSPTPTEGERARAKAALNVAIVDEQRRGTYSRRRLAQPALVAAIVTIVVFAGLLIRSDPAAAALGAIAAAAEKTDPLLVPAQSFAYTRSETTVLVVLPSDAFDQLSVLGDQVAYLLPQTRESWVAPEGVVQLKVFTGTPIFFDAEAESAYYGAGLDRLDLVGETVTETFTGVSGILDQTWPTDSGELADTIRSRLPPVRGLPVEVEMLDIALDLLRETTASPQLRAAALRVIAHLDLDLVEQLPDGSATFAIEYNSPLPIRDTFTVDRNGQLLAETSTFTEGDPSLGIPSGTVTYQAQYGATEIREVG